MSNRPFHDDPCPDLSSELFETLEAMREARGPCPPTEILIEYSQLKPGERSAHPIHSHVRICSKCQLLLEHMNC